MRGAPYSHLLVIKQYFLTQNRHFQKIYVKLRFFKDEFKKSGQFLQTESDIFYIFRIQKTREENQNEYMYMSSTWHFKDKRFLNADQ